MDIGESLNIRKSATTTIIQKYNTLGDFKTPKTERSRETNPSLHKDMLKISKNLKKTSRQVNEDNLASF